MTKLSKLFNTLENWLLPYCCILCSKLSDQSYDLCQSCEQELAWVNNTCLQCGITLEHDVINTRCGQCHACLPSFNFTTTAFDYIDQAALLITQFKFKHQLVYGRVLSELLAKKILAQYSLNTLEQAQLPEIIIPMPLHWWRHTLRGYNQSAIIAKILGKNLSIPVVQNIIKRHKFTKPQRLLNLKARKQNMRGAFKLKKTSKTLNKKSSKQLNYQHIAIVDDVMTTGNTVNTVAKLLKQHGVKTVTVWVLARANHHNCAGIQDLP